MSGGKLTAKFTAKITSAARRSVQPLPKAGRWIQAKTTLNFADFRDGIDKAIARAKRLGEPPDANPSTAVWRLIESLKSNAAE